MHDNCYCYSNTKHVHVRFIAYSFRVFYQFSLILFKGKTHTYGNKNWSQNWRYQYEWSKPKYVVLIRSSVFMIIFWGNRE